jgi:hypothetical protein
MKRKNEDAPVNSTGPAVPGTGSDVAHWKKKKKLKKAKKKLLPKCYEKWIEAIEAMNEGKLLDRLAKLAKVDGAEAENIVLTLKLDKKFNTGTKGLAWHTLVDTVDKLMKESVDAKASATEVPRVDITPDSTFASMPVFKVDEKDFAKCRFGKTKFSRWSRHIDTKSKIGLRIYNYAKKNPSKSIIVQHQDSGQMLYLRKYKSPSGGKSGIMVKKGDKK